MAVDFRDDGRRSDGAGPQWSFPSGFRPWGKSTQASGSLELHPLVDHSIDVASVLIELLGTPRGDVFGPLAPVQLARLAIVGGMLHDIGKLNVGFQAKLWNPASGAGHVRETWALFDKSVAGRLPIEFVDLVADMATWFSKGRSQLFDGLIASISHHGRPASDCDYRQAGGCDLVRLWQPVAGYDPIEGLAELVRQARSAFPAAFGQAPAIDLNPDRQRALAGLVMLADWVGSDTAFFPYRASPGEDRPALARRAAGHALRTIGLIGADCLARPTTSSERTREVLRLASLTPLQQALSDAVPVDDFARLLLVESETGSGKTEAALAWFLRLYGEGRVDGLYFALPTRVAASELYERVWSAVERAFPDAASRPGPVLLTVPGYVRADGQAVLPEPKGNLWDDQDGAARRETVWAAERPKRFLAAPIVVGTIDQALLSVLKVKHSLLRSACLDRHLLVVDEVHASDTYMKQILSALLDRHRQGGGWSLLLSATLGESARSQFFGATALPLLEAAARPYPSITPEVGKKPLASSSRRKDVSIERLASMDDVVLVPRLVEAVAAGARVLVVCNTVGRANSLLRAVEADGRVPRDALFRVNGVTCPHHGRFAREDRRLMDAEVTRSCGKGSPSRPFLLIGTQTLEQSLDIDADWLVSDFAPMDVLLQRVGRLHRHLRADRPTGYALPRVLLRVPSKPLVSYLKDGRLRAPAGLGTVYVDGRVLECTSRALDQRQTLELPLECRGLVEAATHPESWAQLGPEWAEHVSRVDSGGQTKEQLALNAVMERDVPFARWHWSSDGEHVVTRLGADTRDLPLGAPVLSPFGQRLERVLVQGYLLAGGDGGCLAVDARPVPGGFRFEVNGARFGYSRYGLELLTDV